MPSKPRSVPAEALKLHARLGDGIRQMRRELARLREENGELKAEAVTLRLAVRHLEVEQLSPSPVEQEK